MTKSSVLAAALAYVLTIAGASAEPGDNWGQEVKACNQSDCYPGGTSRGTYVRSQAHDEQGPGYGYEIQTLASPGKGKGPASGKF